MSFDHSQSTDRPTPPERSLRIHPTSPPELAAPEGGAGHASQVHTSAASQGCGTCANCRGSRHCGETARRRLLGDVRGALEQDAPTIPLRGRVRSTKVGEEVVDLTLLRAVRADQLALDVLARAVRGGWTEVARRYATAGGLADSLERPASHGVRLLRGTSETYDGRNVFLFLPYAACVRDEEAQPQDFFSLEFLDVYEAMYAQILTPALRHLFDARSQELFFTLAPPGSGVETSRILMNVLHELGHRVGPWRVIPARHAAMTVAPGFAFDALGELSTDLMAARLVPELPGVPILMAFERIYSYARRGFALDPVSAEINRDNDSWSGAFLFQRFLRDGALAEGTATWSFSASAMHRSMEAASHEIEALGEAVLAADPAERDAMVRRWMAEHVPTTNGRFDLPVGLAEQFSRLLWLNVPEVPAVGPMVYEK